MKLKRHADVPSQDKRIHIWHSHLLNGTKTTPHGGKIRTGSKTKLDVCVQSKELQHVDLQLLTVISENAVKILLFHCFNIIQFL